VIWPEPTLWITPPSTTAGYPRRAGPDPWSYSDSTGTATRASASCFATAALTAKSAATRSPATTLATDAAAGGDPPYTRAEDRSGLPWSRSTRRTSQSPFHRWRPSLPHQRLHSRRRCSRSPGPCHRVGEPGHALPASRPQRRFEPVPEGARPRDRRHARSRPRPCPCSSSADAWVMPSATSWWRLPPSDRTVTPSRVSAPTAIVPVSVAPRCAPGWPASSAA
jgi:hypothetical protein